MEQRTTGWTASLDLAGSTTGLVPAVGVPLLRLLAQESGLRAGLSKALHRTGFHPVHDRGQVVTDVAVALAHGARNVAAAAAVLDRARVVCGPAASTATVWRVFDELDEAALARLAAARAVQRRKVWAALAARPAGFPWLEVAGQVWDGWIVVDVDASLVESHSDKQGAAATFKKHIYGLHPIVVSVANTAEVLAVLLREGNAGSNTVADHITVLREAIAQIPARYRKKIIFRADGAGATKDLLAWIKAEAARNGYTWHYSVDVVEAERMTDGSSYGSHPEYLPDFMNDPRDDDGRQVMKLDLAEDRALAAATLSRFPAATGDVIDFESTPFEDRLWWDDEEHWTRMAAELLSSYVQRGERIAVIWGNYLMPAVTMPADVAVRHARDILDAGPHFWIHPLGGSVLIECLMDGQVTVVTIPSS